MAGFSFGGGTLAGGTNAQANIVAFNNLYLGSGTITPTGPCATAATGPSVAWAYVTGGSTPSGATAVTSATTTLDGTQLAFVENSSTGVGTLVVLRPAVNSSLSATNPGVPTYEAPASYPGCTAPCMTTVAFNNGKLDGISSVFYDFSGSDTLYVGDNNGNVHKFTTVFTGTPTETITGGWPVNVGSTTAILTSPVYDVSHSVIYVTASTGILYSINTSTLAVTPTKAVAVGLGIVDSPLVDPSAGTSGTIYAFVGDDNTVTSNCLFGAFPCSAIFQFKNGYASGNAGVETTLSYGSATIPLYTGTFDDVYYNSSVATGNIYTCGQVGSQLAMYKVPITANATPGTGTIGADLSTVTVGGGPTCSPVSEIYNGTTDIIFAGVNEDAESVTGCTTGACIYNFVITGGATPSTISHGLPSAAGSSGILLDNTAATTGASNVYFSTLGNQSCATSGGSAGGCAIQASQSGLGE